MWQLSTAMFLQKKLSVDDVMQDLHLEDSMELSGGSKSTMPRSATYDVGQNANTDEVPEAVSKPSNS